MESLTRATPPTYEISSLRTFYDTYESNICGLEALDVKTDTYGCLLIPILLKKLPESIRYAIFRSDSSADKSLDKLRIALRREIETIEKGRLSTTKSYEAYDEGLLVPTTGQCYPERSHERRARNNAQNKRTAPTVTVTIGQTIATNS